MPTYTHLRKKRCGNITGNAGFGASPEKSAQSWRRWENATMSKNSWSSRSAQISNELWTCSARRMMVARIHEGTSNSKDGGLGTPQFKEIGQEKLNEGFPKCRLAA